MYDIKEAAFWIKWGNLEKLHETLKNVALTIMIQEKYKNDNVEVRKRDIDDLVREIIRQAIGVAGGYSILDSYIKEENHELKSSLRCLYDIAHLYFSIFSDFEQNKFNENLNFSNFIIFDSQESYREYAEDIEEVDEESAIKKEKCLEIVKQLEDFKYTYNENLQYPYEQQDAEDYFESVL